MSTDVVYHVVKIAEPRISRGDLRDRTELAALFFSRAFIECFAGTAVRSDITSA